MQDRRMSRAMAFSAGALRPLHAILLTSSIICAPHIANAAEFGSSPYPKGYLDIFAGIVPTAPGLYVLNDLYGYDGKVGATVLMAPSNLALRRGSRLTSLP
jgi:hypothetical protein